MVAMVAAGMPVANMPAASFASPLFLVLLHAEEHVEEALQHAEVRLLEEQTLDGSVKKRAKKPRPSA